MKPYRRKLSAEEARGQFMLITKDRWPHFPPPGQPFDLRLGNEVYRVAIEAIPCDCVGTPHEHYHLGLAELAPLLEWVRGNSFVIHHDSRGLLTGSVGRPAPIESGRPAPIEEGGYTIAQEVRP